MISLLLPLLLALLPQTAKPCDDAELKQVAGRSDVVMTAEVVEVEPTSELQPWSGLISSKQYVRYRVRAVLKGELSESEVRVGFYLVKNSLTADKGRARLSPELFKEHSVHIVFLTRDPKPPADNGNPPPPASYTAADQDCGALIATPATEAVLQQPNGR